MVIQRDLEWEQANKERKEGILVFGIRDINQFNKQVDVPLDLSLTVGFKVGAELGSGVTISSSVGWSVSAFEGDAEGVSDG